MKKYEELEARIQELQAEVEKLKKAEKEEEKLPRDFNRLYAIRYLETKYGDYLSGAFRFSSTSEGREYWNKIADKNISIQPKDVIQIQEWIILSYRLEFGE